MNQAKRTPKSYIAIPQETERIGKIVLDAAFKVHSALGPGLMESVYEACVAYEVEKQDLLVETQVTLPVKYDEVIVKTGLRLDSWVKKLVIVEFKAVQTMIPLYDAQLLTYLKLSENRLGFLINFFVKHLKHGIKRMVY